MKFQSLALRSLNYLAAQKLWKKACTHNLTTSNNPCLCVMKALRNSEVERLSTKPKLRQALKFVELGNVFLIQQESPVGLKLQLSSNT